MSEGSPALAAIDGWPVEHAAAAVVVGAGVLATHGDQDLTFPLASVTKLLTAMAVLVAVEEESLHLDQPAGPPGSTVAHLLAHASGLGPEGQVLAEPGQRRIYSNAGYDLLAASLEDATSCLFGEYLTEGVLAPLGMTATRLHGSAAHAATSSVADLGRFVGELIEPTLITAATLGRATTVAFPGLRGVLPGFGRQDPNDWGLGPELRGHKSPHWTGRSNSPATFGHFGQSGTFLWVDPEVGTALVVLTDEPFGAWSTTAWPELSDDVRAQCAAPAGNTVP